MGSGARGLDMYRGSRERAPGKGGTMPTTTDSTRHVHRTQGAVTAASASRTPRQSRAVRRHGRRMTLYLVLALLRDRRFREDAIIGAVTLAALAHLTRESEARAWARLAAWWDALERPAERAPANDRPAIDRAALRAAGTSHRVGLRPVRCSPRPCRKPFGRTGLFNGACTIAAATRRRERP